ncbi:MAG TPA: hypothetical protein VKG44_05180 [Candidatus Baltobacteraceae bacterium]|nr:hypothetical protein [Candidatus Baltobacteraceae bacterium]
MLFVAPLATLALTLSGFACERIGPANVPVAIGVELPLAGDDGYRGLAARDGVRFALQRWNAGGKQPLAAILCDSASHIANPHEDEGSDDLAQGAHGAAIVRAFAAEPSILAIVGGLRPDIAAAEAPVAQRFSLALLSATATRVPGTSTFFRTAHSDEAEAFAITRLAARAGFGVPTVRSLDLARVAAMRAILGSPTPQGAVYFAGPAGVGGILAGASSARELESAGILQSMGRRGFDFPTNEHAAFELEPVSGVPPEATAEYQRAIVAAFGGPALDDTFAYDIATTIALSAVDEASTTGAPSRATVLRALRTETFSTLRGGVRFTLRGAADDDCRRVHALDDSLPDGLLCVRPGL